MEETYDLFEGESTIIAPKIIEPKVIAPREDTTLSQLASEDDMKKEAMRDVREALDDSGVDLSYLIDNMKDAVENATTETFSGTLLKDHKTSVSALKQLIDLWKVSHGMSKKEAQEIIFKPLFNKPPRLN